MRLAEVSVTLGEGHFCVAGEMQKAMEELRTQTAHQRTIHCARLPIPAVEKTLSRL